jgi:hypothetical protein
MISAGSSGVELDAPSRWMIDGRRLTAELVIGRLRAAGMIVEPP